MFSFKRSRISLACIRCRKRKVKCDFTRPQCDRCSTCDSSCSYADVSPRVDSHAFDQLGNEVLELKERMKMMQTELSRITSSQIHHRLPETTTWKLCPTATGIRINTNIANVGDLHQVLLNGISQLELNTKTCLHVPGFDDNNGSVDKLSWKPKPQQYAIATQVHAQELQPLVHSCYQSCFLPYQIVDQQEFLQKYHTPQGPQELLLVHSIYAWASKHIAIHHPNLLSNSSTTADEVYFLQAKQLLRRCFSKSNSTTIHALLNLYMYQLSCERPTLAYLYIGLAIRMAQDLGFHKREHMSADLKQREINKRLWWSVYWLDLCAALESNRPTMVDDKDCDMEYPTPLPDQNQDQDQETGYRISFTVKSIELMKIRKAITKHLPSERKSGSCLLDAIAHLEVSLAKWLEGLPVYFALSVDDTKRTTPPFCDEACLILHIQYHTTWIMLHKLMLKEKEAAASPVALLSLDVCIKSANFITQLLQMYAKQTHWCHFYSSCLDGVAESVHIHEKAVLYNHHPKNVTALHHLANTSSILYNSPLNYMQKVRDIVDQIKDFLCQQQPPQANQDIPPRIILLRNPHVNNTDFIQPTYSNEELNQMLSIYND